MVPKWAKPAWLTSGEWINQFKWQPSLTVSIHYSWDREEAGVEYANTAAIHIGREIIQMLVRMLVIHSILFGRIRFEVNLNLMGLSVENDSRIVPSGIFN